MEELTAAHRRALCKLCGIKHDEDIVPDYPTWDTGNDLIAVKEAIEKSGEWQQFYNYITIVFWQEKMEGIRGHHISAGEFEQWLLQPERFCLFCAEWKIQQKGDK